MDAKGRRIMDSMHFDKRTLLGTDVIVGSDLQSSVTAYFAHTLAEGAICVIYDRNVTSLAEELIREFKACGYRVFVQAVSSLRHERECELTVPEYVRHIFAIGAGTAAAYAKKLASTLSVDWSMYLTAPSTDTIMCDISPKTVFIDENVLINCPSCCKAAGYGILFSQPLSAFEGMFASRVLAKNPDDVCVPSQDMTEASELAFALLEISSTYRKDSAQIMSEILYADAVKRGRKPRLIGEYKFLASACITAFYSSFLGAPSIDTMPPACRDVDAERLLSLGLLYNTPKSVDFFDTNSYFRISYILSEYRTDLLDRLGYIDFHTAQRFWRRLYPDAGYWLKGEITCKNLTDCLTLAGYGSDNLLGFAYASGIL